MGDQLRKFEQPAKPQPGSQVRPAAAAAAEIVQFDGPPADYLATLLRSQCELAPAESGAILRVSEQGAVQLVTLYPPGPQGQVPDWVRRAAEVAGSVLKNRKCESRPLHMVGDLYGQAAAHLVLVVPIAGDAAAGMLAAFVVATTPASELERRRERLEMTPLLVNAWEMRARDKEREKDLARIRAAMETLAATNESERFAGVAMSFVNEVSSRWRCDRVSLGFLKGRYVKLKALSHTEKFSRKMKLVQDIEAAQEECIDQDVEVAHPSGPESTFVARAAKELSTRHGPTSVLSLPIRRKGEPLAVLTIERTADEPFTLDEIEALRLSCDLISARLLALEERDKWFGARWASGAKKGVGVVLGAKHTWAKLIVLAVVAAIIALIVARGMYRVEAPFVTEATEQAVIPAPFDSYLESVSVEPGSLVKANDTVLATLDTAEIRLQLAQSQAELATYLKQEAAGMRDGKISDAQVARAEANRVQADIDLAEWRIAKGVITSPIAGTVTKGDLKKQIRAPVKKSDTLFEVAPVESLRAVLSVPEDVIADVIEADSAAIRAGGRAQGALATARHPEIKIPFVVERINPVAEVVNEHNVFKVRVRLLDTSKADWLSAGMEGSARVDIAKRHYAWIWTRRAIDWVRMKLWL